MTTGRPEEIELKLALPPPQVAAFLALMARRRNAPTRHDLLTRYFDTPDFSLSAAGVALRVRRVGRRWLQTLKTEGERQGGLSRRVEFEMPAARGVPDWSQFPPAALSLVPDAMRPRLAPVFETHFRRTAWLLKGRGGAQVEVALDVGEVRTPKGIHAAPRSQPICEIELELKAGQPDALFALALEWAAAFDCLPFDLSKAERGVRLVRGIEAEPVKALPLTLDDGMSVETGYAAMVQACLSHLQANLPGVLTSDDAEFLHQARVALRRLHAAVRLGRKVCALPDALRDGARALSAALGPARDWDVLVGETLPRIAPHYADTDGWQRDVGGLQACRDEARAGMRTALLQAHPGAWLLAMQRWLLQRGWREVHASASAAQLAPLAPWARRMLRREHRRVVRGAREYAVLQPAERHALRIAVKRQRYAAEFFEALQDRHPMRHARYLTLLRALQDSLGRAHDARIAQGLLVAVPPAPAVAFARGWLAAQQAGAGADTSAALLDEFLDLKTVS